MKLFLLGVIGLFLNFSEVIASGFDPDQDPSRQSQNTRKTKRETENPRVPQSSDSAQNDKKSGK